MFIKELSLNTFLGAIVLIIVSFGLKTQALKCYVCEDCDSDAPLHELQVCGMPPAVGPGTPTSILPSSGTPGAQPPPPTLPNAMLTNGSSNESGFDSEESYENSSEDNGLGQQPSRPPQVATGVGSTVGLMPALVNGGVAGEPSNAGVGVGAGISAGLSNASNSTVIGAGPVSTVGNGTVNTGTVTGTVVSTALSEASTVPTSVIGGAAAASSGVKPAMGTGVNALGESAELSEEEEEEDDYENESRKRHRRQLNDPQQNFPMSVCYTIRLSMNDTIITNRGCTTMLDDDREHACNSLFDGWNVEGCQLCKSDECNHLINVMGMSTRFKSSALLLVLSACSVLYFI